MFKFKKALILDMNGTFMFGQDRFGEDEDFSQYYRQLGGEHSPKYVNDLIRSIYHYLDVKYPMKEYRLCFPSLNEAIEVCCEERLSLQERQRITDTFSFHEHGEIPESYVDAIESLSKQFALSLVADIWAPKKMWVETLTRQGLWGLFSATSFSSDHGVVKPSEKPFMQVVEKLGLPNKDCLVIGDSIRRDLGGALAANLDCVLVGGAESDLAAGCYPSLLDFQQAIESAS